MFHSSGGASTSSSSGRHGSAVDEMEVSEILLSLPHLIYFSESRNGFSLKWASKKRRSVINSNSSPPLLLLPPSPGNPKTTADASSPATPLSYLPSESDEKSKGKEDPIRKLSKRKRIEELQETVHNLEKSQREIKMGLEAVKLYHKQLLAYNMAFKAKQFELSYGSIRLPELREEIGNDGSHRTVALPYTMSPMCPSLPSGTGLIRANNAGPFRIPDLNLSAEEASQPLDIVMDLRDYRAKAAGEARKRRILKMKEKIKSSPAITKHSVR